ncbi:3,4-dihydroxy-2-butanone-4-phosphate synthase [Stigmatella sp. ncwal1]|uniref:3,4-dihydroxy-2-butanone 4-phosphate synthase n=1 Tax=Stigmatella ashevillensis TaxID=2995309 RepID=A0ABT5D7E8_9BACT|nr:3,4-dihydroxy-2-butanone-4-phosphate synthase [Stigmatella ashevillena]MDC0708984.1 3,4-dihydroxy-2-butanone-4-phosphate synthase [Stigmatella ashevillena]
MGRGTQGSAVIQLVERALAEIRKGHMVILTDDEDRENEGDLVMAAEKATPEAINFMALHGRGLICLSLTEERIRRLSLPLMVQDNNSPFQTAFTVSIEAARGVTTGISAADRARTIQAAVAPNAKPGDLVRPGHIFPLRAREGGVLVRTGQTEGSVDLARMAGLSPAGVICEIMNPDGTMARRPDLVKFARKHKLVLLSVADIIRYRLEREQLIKRIGTATLERRGGGTFQAFTYGSEVDSAVHVALVKGEVRGKDAVLTRVHRGCLMGDQLGSGQCDCGSQLEQAFQRIQEEGKGVIIYLQKDVPAKAQLQCTHISNEEVVQGKPDQTRLREFGVGAQILKDLGLSRLKLLTNNPKKIVGLESYSLQVVEQIPLTDGEAPRRMAARTPRRRRDKS